MLHPVLNQASAKLLAGDQMALQQVSESSLSGVQRGAPVGLVGAPDALPTAAELTPGAWLACGIQQPAANPASGSKPQLALSVAPAQQGTALTAGQGALVSAPDGNDYLLWQGRRLRVDQQHSALQALGYPTATPFPVTAAMLGTLPAGPDLTSPDIPGRGSPGPTLSGRPTKVGQLFTDPTGGHYVLTSAGLVPLTVLQYDLLLGDPRTEKDAYGGTASAPALIGSADLAAHTAGGAGLPGGLPAEPPALVDPGQNQAICSDLHPSTDGNPVTSVAVLDAGTLGGQAPDSEPGVAPGCAAADKVAVRPGAGALVRALSGSGAGTSAYLVADNGVKYPLPSAAAVKQLGYSGAPTQAVPQALLALLPSGPSLDPAALSGGGVVVPPDAKGACGS